MKQRLSAFLKSDRPSLEVQTVPSHRLDAFWNWLAAFPDRLRDQVVAHLRPDGATVVVAHPLLASLKLSPDAGIDLVARTAADLLRQLTARTPIAWAFDARESHGLNAVEIEALLSAWFAVDAVHAVGDQWRSRVVALLRVRAERLALSCTIDRSEPSAAALDLLDARTLPFWCPVAVIFVSPTAARSLIGRCSSATVGALRRLFTSSAIAPGLFVPDGFAGGDLESSARVVRALAGGVLVRHVRFENVTESPDCKALAGVGFAFDSSYRCLTGDGEAYVRAGAYWPQPFDRRTPAGSSNPDGLIEVVRLPAPSPATWQARAGLDRDRLTPLLTFSRMETYHRDVEPLVSGSQDYNAYRVHAWPPPEPATRVSWFDAGGLESAWSIGRAMAAARRLAKAIGPGAAICGASEFEIAAQTEATLRLPGSVPGAIAQQSAAHGYLRDVPASGPLRADYEQLVRALPDRLGDTLELGSGFGQLASCLSRRASSYVCIELEPETLADMRSRTRLPAVAADLHALPFSDGVFDAVIANNVLEHAYSVPQSLDEICRVLRRGGRVHALIPLDGLNPRHQLRAHWWKADRDSIERALRASGLASERIEPIDLYALGIRGSFPASNGLSCIVTAVKS